MHILIVCATGSFHRGRRIHLPLSIPDFWLAVPFDWTRESRVPESGRQLSPSTRNVFTDFSGLKRKKKKRDEKLLRNIFAEINGGRKREFFSFFFEPVKKHDLFCSISTTVSVRNRRNPARWKDFSKFSIEIDWKTSKTAERGGRGEGGR